MQSAVFLILCFPAVLCQSVNRHVYVYNGYGSSKSHVLRMVEQLKDLLDPSYVIDTIEADAVKTGTWEEDAALFVMPGGFDLGFIESLGDKGAEMIRKYVREGGSYLGQGAGAYYACDRIEFDLAGPDEVVGDRPLKFYPGRCSGPVYGPYNYNDYSGARAAHIDFQFISPTTGEKGESIDMRSYYNGGNTFHVDNRTTSCITLGSYTEKVNNPAIVKCNTYDGVAVLTGVHLQFGSMHLDSDDEFLSVIKDQLQPYESSRIRVYDSILHHLGLTAGDLKR